MVRDHSSDVPRGKEVSAACKRHQKFSAFLFEYPTFVCIAALSVAAEASGLRMDTPLILGRSRFEVQVPSRRQGYSNSRDWMGTQALLRKEVFFELDVTLQCPTSEQIIRTRVQ